MNNFVFSQDPVLFQSTIPMQAPFNDVVEMKKQFDASVAQYQAMQQQFPQLQQSKNSQIDYLGELDNLTKNVDSDVAETLSVNVDII